VSLRLALREWIAFAANPKCVFGHWVVAHSQELSIGTERKEPLRSTSGSRQPDKFLSSETWQTRRFPLHRSQHSSLAWDPGKRTPCAGSRAGFVSARGVSKGLKRRSSHCASPESGAWQPLAPALRDFQSGGPRGRYDGWPALGQVRAPKFLFGRPPRPFWRGSLSRPMRKAAIVEPTATVTRRVSTIAVRLATAGFRLHQRNNFSGETDGPGARIGSPVRQRSKSSASISARAYSGVEDLCSGISGRWCRDRGPLANLALCGGTASISQTWRKVSRGVSARKGGWPVSSS